MSTPLPPVLPPAAPTPPATPTASSDTGTVLAGFLLGWAALIAGIIANAMFWTMQSVIGLPDFGLLRVGMGALPLFAIVALAIWFNTRGKSRSARGVWLALGSMLALLLLLVAACFGLLLTGSLNFH